MRMATDSPPGRNTLMTVLSAYWRWRPFCVAVGLLIGTAAVVAATFRAGTQLGPATARSMALSMALTMMVGTWGIVAAGAAVGRQLKHQFADPRARLLPGFARPHLTAAILVMAGFVAGWTALLALHFNASPPMVAALVLLACTYIAWVAAEVSVWVTLSALIVPFLLMLVPRQSSRDFSPLLRGEDPLAAAVLLATGGMAFAGLLRRMTSLREDQPAYRQNVFVGGMAAMWSWRGRSRQERSAQANLSLMQKLLSRSGELSPQIARNRDSWWRGVRLWTHGSSSQSPVRMGLWFFVFLTLARLLPLLASRKPNAEMMVQTMPHMLAFIAMMGGLIAPTHALQRLPRLGFESLRPVRRRVLAGYLVASAGWESLQFLSVALLPALVMAVAVAPPPSRIIGIWVMVLVGMIVLTFGLTTWVCSGRNMWVATVATTVLVVPIMVGAMAMMDPRGSLGIGLPALVSMTAVAAGAAFTMLGYRRWCRIELG
jgi:hypothetical protein